MSEAITREKLSSIGGMECETVEPQPCNVAKCKEKRIWPLGVPENFVFFGTRVYKKSARECAKELGTTPRQISKLRAGQITQAKPLNWYKENRKECQNSRRTTGRKRSFAPKHLPTGMEG